MEELESLLTIQESDLVLGEWIGGGGFSVVFKGVWLNKGKEVDVAIKKMKISDQNVLNEIIKELKIMQSLQFEHVCKLYGGCKSCDGEQVWLVMEYVDGGDLHHFLNTFGGPLPNELQLSFFIQCTKALVSLHNAPSPIVHRDIKSFNFLVQNGPPTKLLLTDFGLSKSKTLLSKNTHTVAGSINWTAPEVLTKKEWSEKADIYSLGMVFFEIATSTTPYHEESDISRVIQKIKSGTLPKIPSDCSKEIASLISHCCNIKPEKRPTAQVLLGLLTKRSPSPPSDPVVDISDMYGMTISIKHIQEGYFITCQSHRETIEQQILLFNQLAADERFWKFLSDKRRKAGTALHLKIENFIKYGIPPKFRGQMWLAMTDSHDKSTVFTGDLTISEIERNVVRSFPALGEPGFERRLANVLTAYSLRNPQLGYCPAMNFLAGTLLIFMEEENAFWMLVYFVEDLLRDYFVRTMSGLLVDTQVFERLVSENLPQLYKHFQRIHLSMSSFTSSWFLCLFVNYIPTETCFSILIIEVWDNIMLDGISVVFEVGLALLRMHQDILMRHDDELELTVCLKELCSTLNDPKKLWHNWHRVEKSRLIAYRQVIKEKVAESGKRSLAKQISDLEIRTHFKQEDLFALWTQYINIDSFLHYGATGLDREQFAQFVRGTFSEWEVDRQLVEQLFVLSDINKDGAVDFTELVLLLSVMCKGTSQQKVKFNFELFTNSKGGINKFDLYRMLQSVYSMFVADEYFLNLLRFFVDLIFDAVADETISILNFDGVGNCPSSNKMNNTMRSYAKLVSAQPRIMGRFKARNPYLKYDEKRTYYYWMFDLNRHVEIINITLDRKAPEYRSFVEF